MSLKSAEHSECHKASNSVKGIQWESMCVSKVFKRSFKEFSREFQGSFKGVSRVFKGCFKGVLRKCQGSFKHILWEF